LTFCFVELVKPLFILAMEKSLLLKPDLIDLRWYQQPSTR